MLLHRAREGRQLWGRTLRTSPMEINVIYGDGRHLWRERSSMGWTSSMGRTSSMSSDDVIYGRDRDGKGLDINRLPIDDRPRHLCARPAIVGAVQTFAKSGSNAKSTHPRA